MGTGTRTAVEESPRLDDHPRLRGFVENYENEVQSVAAASGYRGLGGGDGAGDGDAAGEGSDTESVIVTTTGGAARDGVVDINGDRWESKIENVFRTDEPGGEREK
jgi:hypothetical protein